MPAEFYKQRFNTYIRNRLRVFIIYYLLSLDTYTIKNVSEIKVLKDKVLIHGKDGENVFEPSKGFNAYVDMLLSVPDTDKYIDGKPFDVRARVFLKSLDNTTDQESIVNLAKRSMNFYVKQTVLYLKEWYGELFYIV